MKLDKKADIVENIDPNDFSNPPNSICLSISSKLGGAKLAFKNK